MITMGAGSIYRNVYAISAYIPWVDVHTVGKNIRLKYFLHGIKNSQRSSNTVKEYPFYVTI